MVSVIKCSGFWGGEYQFWLRRIPLPYGGDGLVCDGAAKGLAVGGGVDFFIDGRIYVG
jgi:hypothetical protein